MITTELTRVCDLDRPAGCETLRQPLYAGDNAAHRLTVQMKRSGEDVDLTGCEAAGYLIRADGATAVLPGEVAANTASVTLTRACYEAPGCFSLIIRLTAPDGTRQTILAMQGAVTMTTTDALVDPAQVIPSLDDLLAQVAVMESASARAVAAADDAEALAAAIREDIASGALTGRGLTILGHFADAEALAQIASPQPGDAYSVGTAAPYRIFIYDGVNGAWVDHGSLKEGDLAINGIVPENSSITLTAGDIPCGDTTTEAAIAAAAARCTPTLLWSGSWSSGSINIPNIAQWRLVQVSTAVGNALCLVIGTVVQGLGSGVNTNQHRIIGVRFSLSGTTASLVTAHYLVHNGSSSHGALTDTTINAVYGLIRKEG